MSVIDYIEGKNLASELDKVISEFHLHGPTNSNLFEKLSYFKRFHPQIFAKYESKILSVMGLFFKVKPGESLIEELYSIFSKSIIDDTEREFTPVQASAFRNINSNTYFSFSAPTSSGKSYLYRELILEAKGDIVIVVPSRALISEYVFEVKEILKTRNEVLVLQFIENVNKLHTERRVYIITPERGEDLFSIIDELNIELFLFDEAQISEETVRGMRFDAFVRRVDKRLPEAKKVFTHPFVENPGAQLLKHNFVERSNSILYNQYSVGKIFISVSENRFRYFSPFEEVGEYVDAEVNVVEEVLKTNGTLLVYISKNKIYEGGHITDFAKYVDLCDKIEVEEAKSIVSELKEFIGSSDTDEYRHSHLIDMMEKGIVIHHGSIPLYARLLIERFVNRGYARICFATSTLSQGINMPFDVVWIDNFRFQGDENQKILSLKNLIGRAGRTTRKINSFDFGYVVVPHSNVKRFSNRMKEKSELKDYSMLDLSIENLDEDLIDIAEAIKEDSFDNELRLTESQIERITKADIEGDVRNIIDALLKNGSPITGSDYYDLGDAKRRRIKDSFRRIYISHLRKNNLSKGESSVLSAAIPILLWQIQGKSFRETVSLRQAFLTNRDEIRRIRSRMRRGELTATEAQNEISKINIRHSPIASPLPNTNATTAGIFGRGTSVDDFNFDLLVYDTYDYLDKVISLSLVDPLCAAFQMYFDNHGDQRAIILRNFIRYGTNDEVEIWLLKYGFGFDEIAWLKEHIDQIDEFEIVFKESIDDLSKIRYALIERYIPVV